MEKNGEKVFGIIPKSLLESLLQTFSICLSDIPGCLIKVGLKEQNLFLANI